MSLVSINTLRDSLVQRLKDIKKSTNGLSPVDCKQIDAIIDAISIPNVTPKQLAAASLLSFSDPTYDFYQINPIKHMKPSEKTCFQFGQGTLGWYFMYGHLDTMAFNIILFRIELGTPKTNRNTQIFNPSDACVYGLTGGYGVRNGPWITIPHLVFRGNYSCGDNGNFRFEALPDSDSSLKSFLLKGNNGTIDASLNFLEDTGVKRFISTNLITKKEPIYQGEDGCFPCIGGVGTLYWSYTNMQASAISDVGSSTKGTGWFDHQWMGIGQPNTSFLRLLQNVNSTLSKPDIIRWFWLTLQLPNDVQYMISHTLSELPEINKTYTIDSTKISGNNVTYNVKGTAKITEMITIPNSGQSFPTTYDINIDNNTYKLKASFGNSLVYLPGGSVNWEGPADVLDTSNNIIVGACGFIEANNFNTEDNLIAQTASLAKVDSSKYNLFRKKKTLLSTGILSILILISIIILIIAVMFYFLKCIFKIVK